MKWTKEIKEINVEVEKTEHPFNLHFSGVRVITNVIRREEEQKETYGSAEDALEETQQQLKTSRRDGILTAGYYGAFLGICIFLLVTNNDKLGVGVGSFGAPVSLFRAVHGYVDHNGYQEILRKKIDTLKIYLSQREKETAGK